MTCAAPPRVVLVTGGSRGIGAATALRAAQMGYLVGVNYHTDAAAAAQVVERIWATGGQAVALPGDVSRESDVQALFDQLTDTFAPVTALVNNAGILEQQACVTEIDAARLLRVLETNVVGTFLCAREAVRRMSRRHGAQAGSS